MGRRKQNRSSGKIDRLPEPLRDTVEQMLLGGLTYREIVAFLKDNSQEVSQMAVCRYARKYLATVEMLKLSQENFRMMADEVDKYPNLDTTEVIMRIASQQVLGALTSTTAEQWEGEEPDKLLKNATALIRAAAYKRKTDLANKTEQEAALEANKALLFSVLSKKHPELYRQVMEAIKREQAILQEGDGAV